MKAIITRIITNDTYISKIREKSIKMLIITSHENELKHDILFIDSDTSIRMFKL